MTKYLASYVHNFKYPELSELIKEFSLIFEKDFG